MMDAERKATWRSLKDADVVVSTCIGAMSDALISNSVVNASTVPDGAEPFRFRTVLIDEASQCAEPGALVPLLVGAEQLILIGDQNQLPPTVLSKEAAQGGLHVSLFERLLSLGMEAHLLTRQYRMPPSIAEFPSKRFYGGKLTTEKREASDPASERRDILWPRPSRGPVAFVDMSRPHLAKRHVPKASGEKKGKAPADEAPRTLERTRAQPGAANQADDGRSPQRSKGSIENPMEAEEAVKIVVDWIKRGYAGEAIGIISPYNAQVRRIRDLLKKKAFGVDKEIRRGQRLGETEDQRSQSQHGDEGEEKLKDLRNERLRTELFQVEVNTVDGFQGREKPLVVFSSVRSNSGSRVGFLSDWRRLNVALTRPREGLVVLGDPRTLKSDATWSAYVRWCQNKGFVVPPGALYRTSGDAKTKGGAKTQKDQPAP
uniref:RNA helicase n=1 Tax=Pinguiococcus pyrenoidosus TaxID=172671 RepID=A0A7R9UH85_9STRA